MKEFTKEFPNYEIESKWQWDNNCISLDKLFETITCDIVSNKWNGFEITTEIGTNKIGEQEWIKVIDFWGIQSDGNIIQVAMSTPEGERIVVIEKGEKEYSWNEDLNIKHMPLLRKENKHKETFSTTQFLEYSESLLHIGKILRRRKSIYLTSKTTFRNFNLIVDESKLEDSFLCQVEIEYKGRQGEHKPDTTGEEIIKEFEQLHINLEKYPLLPSSLRKFDWILKNKSK